MSPSVTLGIYIPVCVCVCFPANPPRVHEAATGLPELCAEERRSSAGSRRLVGRPGLPEAADQLHGCLREPRLLLPPPAATGETNTKATSHNIIYGIMIKALILSLSCWIICQS